MDLKDSPAEAAFRKEAVAFLEEHASFVRHLDMSHGEWEPMVATLTRWQHILFEHGWAAITWPAEYGGRGCGPVEQIIWNQECSRFGVPASINIVGIGMAGPAIIAHGTDVQRERFLPRILDGEEIWCQLFSEPDAGSDLAAVRTRAVRDGDSWVVSGQKVWSSGAHFAQRGILLTRTDPTLPKHGGITFFLLDMQSPGVTVRPLRQITGEAHFNEVFLDEVRIPDSDRVGDPAGGWPVAVTTIMHERMTLGGSLGVFQRDDLVDLARAATPLDPVVRDRIMRVYSRDRCLDFLNARVISKLGAGQVPTAEGSIAKLCAARVFTDAADVALTVLGPPALTDENPWQRLLLIAPGIHLGGGTDEVQRNAVAERVLGLPREADRSRTDPFADVYLS
ncbi:MAG: acyl-CoA dehydrogenase family protein [Acidimicrobiia bacterium]|nr:acyl-CoA dehydrogenase family protein [Acidimicrobiia bacterium]